MDSVREFMELFNLLAKLRIKISVTGDSNITIWITNYETIYCTKLLINLVDGDGVSDSISGAIDSINNLGKKEYVYVGISASEFFKIDDGITMYFGDHVVRVSINEGYITNVELMQ